MTQEEAERIRGEWEREEGERMMRIIAERKRQERRYLEKQKHTDFEDSEEEESGRPIQEEQTYQETQEGEPLTHEEITMLYDEKLLSELIESEEIQKCNDCNRLSYVKRWGTAIMIYQQGCQIEGCKNRTDNERRGKLDPMKKYREERHWPKERERRVERRERRVERRKKVRHSLRSVRD